ncbi:unnamed protein product [Discula destructiva]
MIAPREDGDVVYYNPAGEIYTGLWILLVSATVFLGLRLWVKLTRRHGLWFDDYVLLLGYSVLLVTDIIITYEYANGYSNGYWDDRMHMLINTSSIGTVIGQAVTKTAFGVTLLRMIESKWQMAFIWFCIISMDGIALSKCIFQWAKLCGKDDYQQWYRIQGWCLNYAFSQEWKEIGNIYNIVMDFIFALFPWLITWRLHLKRAEKIALCITLSLGVVVAIITAVRTWWKDTPLMHVHDEWYIWRDAMSQIWYSAEVAGTIIVQCIPVLRPFVKDLHTTLTSKKLAATEPSKGSTWRGSTLIDKKTTVSIMSVDEEAAQKHAGTFELAKISEEIPRAQNKALGYSAEAYYSASEVELGIHNSHTQALNIGRAPRRANWPL